MASVLMLSFRSFFPAELSSPLLSVLSIQLEEQFASRQQRQRCPPAHSSLSSQQPDQQTLCARNARGLETLTEGAQAGHHHLSATQETGLNSAHTVCPDDEDSIFHG